MNSKLNISRPQYNSCSKKSHKEHVQIQGGHSRTEVISEKKNDYFGDRVIQWRSTEDSSKDDGDSYADIEYVSRS